MTGSVRGVVAVVVLFFASGVAFAQREVAPAPHLALDELVKEYKHWGLPVPAADAQLVRLKKPRRSNDPFAHFLAFRNPLHRPGDPARPQTGDEWMFEVGLVVDEFLDKPTRADLERVSGSEDEWLRFAVVFQLRGWDGAAKAAYTWALDAANTNKVESEEGEPPPTMLTELRLAALGEWHGRLCARESDRREVRDRLRELVRLEPQFLTPSLEATLKDLELTLASRRKSKPGSPAALVDELTEYWEDGFTGERRDAAYWKLVEFGFDAVPALIESLTDRRLTRSQFGGFNNFRPYTYRINHLTSRLLNELSGTHLEQTGYFDWRGDTIDPIEARKWWETARAAGEERWLLDHVLPPKGGKGSSVRPSKVILRAIQAKYPHRLREVYWAVLLKRPDVASEDLAVEIAASALSRERKLELLEQGASHRDYTHRRHALEALITVDGAVFRKHWLRTLKEPPNPPSQKIEGHEPDVEILEVARKTADPECWAALLAVSRAATPDDRLRIIHRLPWFPKAEAPAVAHRELIRYLLSFRHDTAVGEFEDQEWAVYDLAAVSLAFLLGVERPLGFEPSDSPRERSLFRARVWQLAERELALPAK